MSLPPQFLDEIRARVPLSRVIGRKVVWDLRRSNQARSWGRFAGARLDAVAVP